MLKGQIIGGEQTLRHLQGVAPKMGSALDRRITALTIKLTGKVKSDKLSGQVLGVKTGRLRRSINPSITGQGTGAVTGKVGTNVEYARVHEQGFHASVKVKEHLRMQTTAFGKSIAPQQVTVREHWMTMNIPPNSFLRSALAEMRPEILSEIQAAVHEGVQR